MSKKKNLGDLINDNKENAEKLSVADIKVTSDKDKIEKKISKLILDNKQNSEELSAAYKIIATQEKEIKKQAEALIRADKEKEKQRTDLISAKKELAHKAELIILNKKLLLANRQEKLAKEKYIELYNFAPIGYFTLNREGEIIESNLFASQILGKEHSLLKDHWYGNFVSDVTKPIFNHFIEQIFKSQTKQVCEVTLLTDNNLPKHVFLNGIISKNDEQCLVTINDITDRKQAENALKESEKRFKTIFNQAPIAITLLDTEGHTIISNLPLSNMVGYNNDELSKMKFTDFTYHEDVDKDMNQFIELIGGRISNYSMEKRFVHKNGNLVWGNLFVTIIHDENGMSNEIIGMTVDITEQKQTESELIKAKEKAEESDRLKSAFLTNMSHEIRTPMNGILGFAELLKMPGISGDEKQEYIDHIKKSSDRMLNIINDLVDISKIEAGLVKVDHDQSNINEQTKFVYNSFKIEAKAKGLNLSYRTGMPDGESIITTDKKKVDSILTNLVKNAIKYMDQGSIEFGYNLKSVVPSSSHAVVQSSNSEVVTDELEFYVKDTGIGIPVDRQQAIFDRFVQADIADTMAYQGAGLGLSIAKAYVEMLGGRIWVESEEGKGSTFCFTLPYNPVFKIKTEEDTIVSPAVTGAQINNLKILIVEDDDTSVILLMIMLKEFSREILITDTGFEAIEICRNNPDIDLILMDIKMPVMDGYEATRQVRMYNKSVVILAQTAYGLTGDTEKAIQAGCDDYISKPISIEKLRSLINKYFA